MVESELAQRVDLARIERAVREILAAIGEEPDREGLLETPRRVARYFAEVTAGLHLVPERHLATTFAEGESGPVLVGEIPFHSLCEHHLLPFFGRAHLLYLPCEGRIVGLSKIARLIEELARRPQVQERLTAQVADLVMRHLDARGVLVMIEAQHMCMAMRGVKKEGALTKTMATRGLLATDPVLRQEALALIRG